MKEQNDMMWVHMDTLMKIVEDQRMGTSVNVGTQTCTSDREG